jgi:hypothetical protein
MKKIEMIGKRFGKLIVNEELGKNKNGHIRYLCQCDCGDSRKMWTYAKRKKR